MDAAALPRAPYASNALQLHALAYNLAKFLRNLTLPEAVMHWSRTTLRDRLPISRRHGAACAVPADSGRLRRTAARGTTPMLSQVGSGE